MAIIITWKKEGLSMGELLESLQLSEPATYAGRLDPLARGVCVMLSAEDRHKKDDYLKQSKEYLLEVLLDVSTDSNDSLGIITNMKGSQTITSNEAVVKALQDFGLEYNQTPPAFSSIPINGQPSFIQARQETPQAPPDRMVQIDSIELLSIHSITSTDLVHETINRINSVQGDFRQSEIINSWEKSLNQLPPQLTVCKLRVNCGSGTYMRSLARDLGVKLNTHALALRILRSRVGHFKLPFVQ